MHIRKYKGFCNICQREVSHLPKHKYYYHRQTVCNHCNHKFRSPEALKAHMHSVNGSTPKRKCPECSKYFINLRDHIRTVHRGEIKPCKKNKRFCHTCKKFVLKEEFIAHRQICKPHTCSICSKEVVWLEQHLLRAHSQNIICVFCNATFDTIKSRLPKKQQLRNHIYDIHIPRIFVELGITENINTENIEVRESIAQYLVDKQCTKEADCHKCQLCLETFSTKTKIINHMKYHLKYTYHATLHRSENAPCTDCGKMMKRTKLGEHVCLDVIASKIYEPQTVLLAPTTFPLEIINSSPIKPLIPISTKQIRNNSPSKTASKIQTTLPSTTLNSQTVKQKMKTTTSLKPRSQNICNECGKIFKESSLLATHMDKHLKQKVSRDLKSVSQKKAKCACPGCLLQSCGQCQTCRNKHFKKRCLFRKCIGL